MPEKKKSVGMVLQLPKDLSDRIDHAAIDCSKTKKELVIETLEKNFPTKTNSTK